MLIERTRGWKKEKNPVIRLSLYYFLNTQDGQVGEQAEGQAVDVALGAAGVGGGLAGQLHHAVHQGVSQRPPRQRRLTGDPSSTAATTPTHCLRCQEPNWKRPISL